MQQGNLLRTTLKSTCISRLRSALSTSSCWWWSPRGLIPGERVSLGEVRQRWSDVCHVATEQDPEGRHIKSPLCVVVQSRLSISSLSGHQLLEERTTLSTVLLPSVYLQRTTGMRKLPGDNKSFGTDFQTEHWDMLNFWITRHCPAF